MDLVNHPQHYEKHSIKLEPIDICEELPFCLGNVIKYCFRYLDKGTPELDLQKALFYLDRQIDKTGEVFFINQVSERCTHVLGLFAETDRFCKALQTNDLLELRHTIEVTLENLQERKDEN